MSGIINLTLVPTALMHCSATKASITTGRLQQRGANPQITRRESLGV